MRKRTTSTNASSEERRSFQRILVAVDGSESSRKAAHLAVDLATTYGASLFVVRVITNSSAVSEYSSGGTMSQALLPKQVGSTTKSAAEEIVQEIVSLAENTGVKVRGERIGDVPSVAGAIIEYSNEWKVDLIVVGTRGLTGFKKILLGSVSQGVVEKAGCSVLVVR